MDKEDIILIIITPWNCDNNITLYKEDNFYFELRDNELYELSTL